MWVGRKSAPITKTRWGHWWMGGLSTASAATTAARHTCLASDTSLVRSVVVVDK